MTNSIMELDGKPHNCPICNTKSVIEVIETKQRYDVQCKNCKWSIMFVSKYMTEDG